MEVPHEVKTRSTLGIYPKHTETLLQRDARTPVLTAALFTIRKVVFVPREALAWPGTL